ncbi:MAG TPA: restriction endonuclease subunit S [Thermoanaerobaculia bacterium]|nr:restriction endonuclease subunit S [Thermoanaerobaculia bacterium]
MEVKPGYKQTEVGVIPKDWEVASIGSLASFRSGEGISIAALAEESPATPIPVYGGNGIAGYTNRALVRESVVVVGRVGQNCGEVYFTGGPAWITDNALYPRFLLRRVDLRFLTLALQSAGLNTVKNRNDLPLVTQSILHAVRIPLPPTKAEEEAIAAALSDADALVEFLEQRIAKKRQFKQGAMQELLLGKKRLPGFRGKWRTCQIGEVINDCSSGATPYRGRPDYYRGTIKWITSGELNFNVITDSIEHISEEAVKKTHLRMHPAGTFLMAITGLEAAGTRGACGIVGSPATTNQSCMAIYPSAGLTTAFLYHYYVLRGNDLALRYCQGTKQQSYTAKLVGLLPIDLPPTVEEQTAIATIFSDMDAEITALEAQRVKTRALRQGIMQDLLTGRIRLV